jgi:hypothetical protein
MDVASELARLKKQTPAELRREYAELFGEESRSRNKAWLVKRILWRLQADAEGDLSERARRRALELADDRDLRVRPPVDAAIAATPRATAATPKPATRPADPRLPMPGAVLTREYKGRTVQVLVREDGFEYDGELYPSLSAVARAVTGSHWNGYGFFCLGEPERGR